jgi:hypothetical protein
VLTCDTSCSTPSGSYSASCTSCATGPRTTGCALTCDSCTTVSGTQNPGPSIALPCSGTISNQNGVLQCSGCVAPGGSYAASCTGCAAQSTSTGCVLECQSCREANGTENANPTLALPCSSGSASNQNGSLVCD